MEEIDAQADVYALGVMLFEALTGAVPYDTSGHASDVMLRIREAPPTLPSRLSSRVDRELDTILLKALEKEKSRRYQSVAELGEDIGRYLRGEPIRARRPSRFYVLRKNVHKHRRWVVVGAIALALGLIGLWGGSEWRNRSLERQRMHELTQARRDLLYIQQLLERGEQKGAAHGAYVLAKQYAELPEARLVLAQSKFRDPVGKGRVYALEVLEKDLRRDSSRWSCAALLAEMYRITGDDARAAELEARLERNAPETGEEWYVRSFATMNSEEALRRTEEAVKRQPTQVLAWERLTGLCLLTGEYDRALDAMDMLTRIAEDPGRWAFRKVEVYVSQRRFREALAQCNALLGDRDAAPDAYRYRAHIKRHQARNAEAIQDYTTAIALVPKTRKQRSPVWTHYQRATPLWIVGRTKEAAEDCRLVRAYLGRAFYGDARLYLILRDDGHRDEAEKVLDNALESVVDDPWLTKILQCLAGQLAPDELIKDALSRDNHEHLCEAYYYAGEVYRLSGGLEKARDCFEKCLETGVEYDLNTPFEPMNEYELAQWRLAQLDSTTDATSQRVGP